MIKMIKNGNLVISIFFSDKYFFVYFCKYVYENGLFGYNVFVGNVIKSFVLRLLYKYCFLV